MEEVEIQEAGGPVRAGATGLVGGHHLPLGFGREPGVAPAGEGVGFVVAHVGDGLGRIDRTGPGQREDLPTVAVPSPGPVQRRLPRARQHRSPTVGKPQLGPPVAAIVHERQPFPTRDGAVGQREGCQMDVVARGLVVEGEAPALVADPAQPAAVLDPSGWHRVGGARPRTRRPVGGP